MRSLPDGVAQVLAEYLESSNRPAHTADADGPDYEVENDNGHDQEAPAEKGPPSPFGASLADQPLPEDRRPVSRVRPGRGGQRGGLPQVLCLRV